MKNNWILSLVSLSFAVVETNAFVTQQSLKTVRNQRFGLGHKTSLSLPYQLYDAEIAQSTTTHNLLFEERFLDPLSSSVIPLPTIPSNNVPQLEDVKLSLLPTDDKAGSLNKFPLVVRPTNDSSVEFLTSFLRHHKQWVDKKTLEYGAVLFRGFGIESAKDVETAIRAVEPNLNNQYRGTSPRHAQGDTEYVFSAAEVPSTFPIAQHLEMSFLPAPPKRLFFSALQAPKTVGGETALADFRQVYRDLPTQLRGKLLTKKLRYRRTHYKKGARFTNDVASMQSWSDVFGTSDPSQVEQIAKDENLPMEWQGKNKNVFVSEYISEPFQLHPQTMEPVWFNHAQAFHWTTFPAELFFAFVRTKEPRFLVRAFTSAVQSFLVNRVLGRKMALDISFGDGTPISMREMHQIRRAIHKNMVFNRWEQGDLVMIDNFSTSHGRQPTYDQGRKVVVAWSDPAEKANLLTKEEPQLSAFE